MNMFSNVAVRVNDQCFYTAINSGSIKKKTIYKDKNEKYVIRLLVESTHYTHDVCLS